MDLQKSSTLSDAEIKQRARSSRTITTIDRNIVDLSDKMLSNETLSIEPSSIARVDDNNSNNNNNNDAIQTTPTTYTRTRGAAGQRSSLGDNDMASKLRSSAAAPAASRPGVVHVEESRRSTLGEKSGGGGSTRRSRNSADGRLSRNSNNNNLSASRIAQKMKEAYPDDSDDDDYDEFTNRSILREDGELQAAISTHYGFGYDNNGKNEQDNNNNTTTKNRNANTRRPNVATNNNDSVSVIPPGASRVVPSSDVTTTVDNNNIRRDEYDSQALSAEAPMESTAVTATIITQEELVNEVRQQMMGDVVEASKVDADDSPDETNRSIRRLLFFAISALVCAVVAIVVVFVVVVGGNGNKDPSPVTAADNSRGSNNDNSNKMPTNGGNSEPSTPPMNPSVPTPPAPPNAAPTSPPTPLVPIGDFSAEEIAFLNELQNRGSSISLQDQSTPQFEAFLWMTQEKTSSDLIRNDQNGGAVAERFALAVLYFSTNGPSWTRSDYWLSSEDACAWYLGDFIQCTPRNDGGGGDKKIFRLELSNNNLQGTIPMELGFAKWEILDLSVNNLSGPLPDLNLKDVGYLDLSHNQLTGRRPDRDLSKAKALAYVDLSYNSFDGDFPDDFWEQSTLTHLDLSFNMFDESLLPVNFDNLGQLTYLGLAGTGLTGPVPLSISSLASGLRVLDISGNSLSSEIPDTLFTMPNLETLHLQNNLFMDSFSADTPTTTMSSLASIRLDGNNIAGNIPSFLCDRRNEFNQQQQQPQQNVFELYADCGELACSCCTHCCSDDGNEGGCVEIVGPNRFLRNEERNGNLRH